MTTSTKLLALLLSLAAVVGLASAASATSPAPPRLQGPAYLHTIPGLHSYGLLFRLTADAPRRSDGSYDAGTKTGATRPGGYDDAVTEFDRRHHCYEAAVDGRDVAGSRVTVRILIGDGHDPVGQVHSPHDIVTRLTAHRGQPVNRDDGPLTASDRAQARRMGCTSGARRGS